MPFTNYAQSIVILDVEPQKTTKYTSSGPVVYDYPCAAFYGGFITDIAVYGQHVTQYAYTAGITENDIFVVIIPMNLTKQLKIYLLEVIFNALPVNYVRFEYRSAMMMYGEHLNSAVVVEKVGDMYQVVPYISGYVIKEYISYAADEETLKINIESLYLAQLNMFARKQLQNQLFFTYENDIEEEIANKLNVTVIDCENRDMLVFEGTYVITKLGNLMEECFVRGQNDYWPLNM